MSLERAGSHRRCFGGFLGLVVESRNFKVLRNERKKQRDQRGSKNTIHMDYIQWKE